MSEVPHTHHEGKYLWWKTAKARCLEAAASWQARIISYLSHVNLNGMCVHAFVCVCVCVCVCVRGYPPSHIKVRAGKWKTAGVTLKRGFQDVDTQGCSFYLSLSTQSCCASIEEINYQASVIKHITHTHTYEYGIKHTDSDGWCYKENSV